MITLYQVDGESFFCFPNWHLHQRIQTKKSKFPPPPESTVDHRESPSEIETETEIETEEETEVYSGEEPASPPPVILLPLDDGTEYPVSYREYAEFVELYQAVDVLQQLKEGPQADGEWQTIAKIANAICHIAKMARTRTRCYIPRALEEVREHCLSRGNHVDTRCFAANRCQANRKQTRSKVKQ